MKRAVCLLSGGLDSATSTTLAKVLGFEIYALTFDYGQRHNHEIACALEIARELQAKEHKIINLDLRQFGGSALTSETSVPTEPGIGIPITYVPARNTIFLSIALAWAEVLGAEHIFIGANAVDYSGYPDCRAEYLQAFEDMANLATKAGVEGTQRLKICAPLIGMTKAEIIQTGHKLGVPYHLTSSCYNPNEYKRACGVCDSCRIRIRGFSEAQTPDPIPYQDLMK